MRSSIINHPENEPLIIIRQWQLVFCDGNEVAAALMSFFEYWHNIKLDITSQNKKANDVAIAHGDEPAADTRLYQWHTESELISGIQRIAKSSKTLSKGIDTLENKGVITIHKNPNPRYKFDKTRHFLFQPEIVNQWLDLYRSGNFTLSSSKNTSRSSKNTLPEGKNTPAIPETTTETTTESLKEPSANADHSHISLLTINDLKDLKLPLPVWKQYLADEHAGKGRKGVTNFIDNKISFFQLRPVNESELKLFEILADEYEADGGKAPPNKFPTLETKRLFNEGAIYHNGTLETVIKKAIHKRGKGIGNITDYISSSKWRDNNGNGQRSARAGQQTPNSNQRSQPNKFAPAPGAGQSPEMAARLRDAFAPK